MSHTEASQSNFMKTVFDINTGLQQSLSYIGRLTIMPLYSENNVLVYIIVCVYYYYIIVYA